MSKILTDMEMADIIHRAITDPWIIDDQDLYIRFLNDLGTLIADYFGGECGTTDSSESEYYTAFHINENVPVDGGVYSKYDKDVLWENGVESEHKELKRETAMGLIREKANAIYEGLGQQALYEWADTLIIPYRFCRKCDTETPCLEGECLSCGSPIKDE